MESGTHMATVAEGGEVGAVPRLLARLERLPFTREHLTIAAILGAGTFFDGFDSLIIASAVVAMVSTLHLGPASTGVLISSAYIGQIAGALTFGSLSELVGRRPTFIASLVIFGLLSLATATAWNFGSLFAFRVLQGIGLGAEVPIAGALFNEFVRGRTRGRVVLLYQTMFPWGIFIAPLTAAALYGLLGQAVGWRVLFVIGGLALVVAAFAYWKLPESPRWLAEHGRPDQAEEVVGSLEASAQRSGATLEEPRVEVRPAEARTRFTELLSRQYRGRSLVSWTQWFTCYFVTYGLTTWLPTLYVTIGRLPVTASLLLAATSSGIGVIVVYLFALNTDRVGRKPFFVGGFSLAVLGAIFGASMVAVQGRPSWPVLFVGALAMQLGVSFSNVGVYVYTPELFPTRMRVWATAFGSSWNRVGAVIAPILIGLLLAAHLGIGSVFIMFGVAAAVGGLVIALWGIETKQRTLEELAR